MSKIESDKNIPGDVTTYVGAPGEQLPGISTSKEMKKRQTHMYSVVRSSLMGRVSGRDDARGELS